MSLPYPNATRISEHLLRSEAYCHCGCTPSPEILANMITYSLAWEKVRKANGDEVVHVNCLFRCPKHNATLPGAAPHSQHLLAKASDNTPGDGSEAALIKFAKAALNVPEIHGISIYEKDHGGFVHIDTRTGPRWLSVNGVPDGEARFWRCIHAGRIVP